MEACERQLFSEGDYPDNTWPVVWPWEGPGLTFQHLVRRRSTSWNKAVSPLGLMPWVRASLPSATQGSFQTPLGLLLALTESGRVKAKLHVQKCYFSPASKESPTPDAF